MVELRFEWDENKNRLNQRKHGVSFDEAAQAFSDPVVMCYPDRVVDDEQRWHSLGLLRGVLLVLVVHTTVEHEHAEVVRIISARYANSKERQFYEEENG